jgi:small neutral amino acid transporter SnatA (MarC family)
MNGVMVVLAFTVALNPFRARLGLPGTAGSPARLGPAVAGMALGATALLGLAVGSGPALSALEVTPETFVIAAGLVAVLGGAWVLGFPEPADEPEASGWLAGLWPVAFPRVVGPETITLALAVGARAGVAEVALGAGVGLALLGALAVVPLGRLVERVLVWCARVGAALLIVVGVWLMIEGIRDV